MNHAHPEPRLAITRGAQLALPPDLPTDPAAAIAFRIAQSPQGVIRTYNPNGESRAVLCSELWRRAARIASGLRNSGASAGTPIVLLTDDALDFVPAFWACVRAGCTVVPLMNAALAAFRHGRDGPFRAALDRLHRPIILCDETFAEAGATLKNGRRPTLTLASAEAAANEQHMESPAADPLCLLPTSGSTSGLKLVAVGSRATINRIFALPRENDHWLATLALDSVTAQNGVFLRFRSWTQMPADALTARPTSVLDAIELCRITVVGLTNSAVKQLLAAAADSGRRWDLGSLRQFGLGAETIVPRVVEELAVFLKANGASPDIIRAVYGSTETGFLVAGANPIESLARNRDAVSLGGCAPGVELRVVGNHGALMAEGEIGDLHARCPQTIFSGYWGDAEATNESFSADGWWRTGDLGRLQNGELSLHGRAKEILVLYGKKFSLATIDAEIEPVLAVGDRAFSCAILWPGETAERLAVVFVAADDSATYRAELAEKIDRVIARLFGFRPSPILATTIERIPFAANGKLRRQELAVLVRSGAFGQARQAEMGKARVAWDRRRGNADLEATLARIWCDTLNLGGKLDRNANFFDLGGDSLRSLTLHTAIEEQFGKQVSADAFFAQPTFAKLLEIVAGNDDREVAAGKVAKKTVPWPLPADLRNKLLVTFGTWEGNRPTRDRLVAGLNATGTKTPLFWVTQDNITFRQLADSLGVARPVYAFRSGQGLIEYTEDEIQTFALRYASELAEVCPDGPVFIGGNCQGAIIALALAQHLLRRGRHVSLLILLDWGFPLQPYPGPVLLVHGRDAFDNNPYLVFRDPDSARAHVFADYTAVELPGEHGVFYERAFREVLPLHLLKAETHVTGRLPRAAHRALLHADEIPAVMTGGERRTIAVTICNLSDMTWPATEISGLTLGNRWLDRAGNVIASLDGRVPLPELRPHIPVTVSLPITVPSRLGSTQLIIDVVEDGNTWFCLPHSAPLRGRVVVAGDPTKLSIYELVADLEAANVALADYQGSTSWKVTRPLRKAKLALRRVRHAAGKWIRPPSLGRAYGRRKR